jgi:hypothetical protein
MALLLLLFGCSRGPSADLAQLQDPQSCAACHPAHHDEWSGSMHAYASEDPVFQVLNRLGQEETNGELGDFCVQCHAPLAVELGLTDDGLNLDEIEPELLGIPCLYCHSVSGVAGAHNNPLEITLDGVLRGGIEDPVRNSFHESAYSPLMDRNDGASAAVCGSCHDVVTPTGVHTDRTFLEWRETLYGNPEQGTQNLTCGQCHMNGVDAPVAEIEGGQSFPERRRHAHTWPGVDVALTPFPNRDVQRQLVADELASVINPNLCVFVDPVDGDASITVDLEQLSAGHSFPSGAAADRRVWVELVAYENEQIVFETGRIDEGTPVRSVVDPDRWEFGDFSFDEAGEDESLAWKVAGYDSNLLLGPTTRSEADPDYRDPHELRSWFVEGFQIDRVELRMWMRPIGLEVIDSLIPHGLDPAVRDEVPTFELESAALTWTPDLPNPCVRVSQP